MKKFRESTIEKLKYYVYGLRQEGSNDYFYIGKGNGDRVFGHEREEGDSDKVNHIKELNEKGIKIERDIIRYGLTEEQALLIESTLISLLGIDKLKNIVRGHDSNEIYTVEAIDSILGGKNVEVKHKILFVKLNSSWNKDLTDEQLEDITKGYWVLNTERMNNVEYVCGYYKGMIKSIFKFKSIHTVTESDNFRNLPIEDFKGNIGRKYIVGEVAEPEVREYYINNCVDVKFGTGSAIAYVD